VAVGVVQKRSLSNINGIVGERERRMENKMTPRRLCKSAREGDCAFGEPDGSCAKLDAFVLNFCKKGRKGRKK